MELSEIKNKNIKQEIVNNIYSGMIISNKYIIDEDINFSKTITIKFVTAISQELIEKVKKVGFECVSCGGPDKARIEISIKVKKVDIKLLIDDIIGCTIAYKQYTTPHMAIKKEEFTDDLKNDLLEFIDKICE